MVPHTGGCSAFFVDEVAEWYAEDGREGESQWEVVFVKMDGFGFNINVLYANNSATYTDGKMYPTITVEFMKFDLE